LETIGEPAKSLLTRKERLGNGLSGERKAEFKALKADINPYNVKMSRLKIREPMAG